MDNAVALGLQLLGAIVGVEDVGADAPDATRLRQLAELARACAAAPNLRPFAAELRAAAEHMERVADVLDEEAAPELLQ